MTLDFERRFGGLQRLYGLAGAQRMYSARVMVVGIGGVGSWAAEALARSGVGCIGLVDMDHIAESNINRQIHAHCQSVGQAKVLAMQERIGQINPACQVHCIDDFVGPDNWPAIAFNAALPAWDAIIDCCDQAQAKLAMAAWLLALGKRQRPLLVCAGAAGGKRLAHKTDIADLADTTHDPLLAKLRYSLRRSHGAARTGAIGLACVYSQEAVAPPDASCAMPEADGSLNCHGYGSSVAVTASFGLAAAGWVMEQLVHNALKQAKPVQQAN
jgi:tRNA threonylcarbamoyladenosine dehydratase